MTVNKRKRTISSFHSIFENATIGMYRTTPDGQILMANPALVQMMGYASFEDLTQRNLLEEGFQPGYERDKFQSEIRINGEVRGYESGWVKKDGTPFFVRESAKAITDASGNVLYYEGTVEDITDRKQAELALQASEENYRRLVENSESAIAVLDQSGQILYANAWAIKVWNDPMIVGKSIFDLYPDEYSMAYLNAIQKVIHTRTAIIDEVESLIKGHMMWFRISMTPLRNPAGIVDRVLLNAWDITGRKQAEEELLFRNVLLSTQQEVSIDGILVVGENARILSSNRRFIELWGVPAELVENGDDQPVLEFVTTRVQDPGAFLQRIHYLYEHTHETSREEIFVKNGRVIERYSAPMFGPNDRYFGRVWYFRDITDRKRAEDELRASEEKYRSLIESINSVITTVDVDGIIHFANRIAALQLGCEPADIVGKNMMELFPQEIAERQLAHIRQVIKKGEAMVSEAPNLIKGQKRWYLSNIQPVRDSMGNVLLAMVNSQDITAQKLAEKAILESERQMRALVTSLDDIVIEIDEQGRYLNVWTGDESLLAQPKAKLLEANVGDVLGDENDRIFKAAMQRALQNSEPEIVEYPLVVIGGQRWFQARINPIVTQDHSRRTLSVLIRDITERKIADERLRLQLQRMNALSEIDRAIASSQDVNMSLDILLNQVLSQLNVDATCVLLLKSYDQSLQCLLGKGFRTASYLNIDLHLGEGLAGQVGSERRSLHVPDLIANSSRFRRAELLQNEQFVEYFGVPLIAKGMLKGVLEIFHRSHLKPDLEWVKYLETLGGQAAIAIDNAQLFEGMQQSNLELVTAYDATIEGWSKAMDLRDKETEGHSQRVTDLTLKLAKKMGVRPEELVNIRRGALLHDIGKLGVPDHILFKPQALNEDEWESMRQHPTYAYNMLMPIKYLNNALDIPYCHHEKWDGSGYPRGLKGEQIPLAARIFAIVDVWDALRSDRPYRASWSSQDARQYILSQSGKHFDPKIVEIFMRMIEDE
jgi:PAS domain S-box-containing protein